MLFGAPLKGNPPLSRHSLILATQAGPQRALSDLIHCTVCPTAFKCVCISCACMYSMFTFYNVSWCLMTGHAVSSRTPLPQKISTILSSSLLFCFEVATATGELLMTWGIVVLPQISCCLLHERGEEEQEKSQKGREAWKKEHFRVFSEMQEA